MLKHFGHARVTAPNSPEIWSKKSDPPQKKRGHSEILESSVFQNLLKKSQIVWIEIEHSKQNSKKSSKIQTFWKSRFFEEIGRFLIHFWGQNSKNALFLKSVSRLIYTPEPTFPSKNPIKILVWTSGKRFGRIFMKKSV